MKGVFQLHHHVGSTLPLEQCPNVPVMLRLAYGKWRFPTEVMVPQTIQVMDDRIETHDLGNPRLLPCLSPQVGHGTSAGPCVKEGVQGTWCLRWTWLEKSPLLGGFMGKYVCC